ncbi:MAG: Acyl-CoA dehydrogenase [bacterium ADurb.Bin236]|nr:MAG: Acyl-CoA dehydrogenase [bacterium ADurb.Bin236]HOY62954.1 acyl-CoA dehydrogenase family protein [bacterium]HPN95648.1 acyl-CoA dehydrogenase family protein [bacterium]
MIDFKPTQEQLELQKMAKKFAREVIRPAELAIDKMQNPDEAYASPEFRNTLRQAYELGFHKMTINVQHGGLGLDPLSTALVWEELAVGGVGIPATLLAGMVAPAFLSVLAGGKKELIEKHVVPYCDDTKAEHISAWGSSEGNIGSDGSNYYDPCVHHETSAKKEGSEYIITGAKSSFVSNGSIADLFLVFACVDQSKGIKGSGVFLVPLGQGVERGKSMDKLGMRALNQGEVCFDGARIPEGNMIMPPGDGYPTIHNAIKTVGNIGVGYLAVGLMRAAYEEALQYAKERVQFGKPIFQHQAIGFRLFEAYQAIEAARGLLWKASWTLANKFMGDLKLSAAARVFATNLAMKHTVEMVQILGGYGISKEYNLEKYMRDAKLLQIMDATNEIMTIKGMALL